MKNLETRRNQILRISREKSLLEEENLLKWHGKVNRNVVLLERDFAFSSKKVLDIGSSYGNTLLYWAEGSIGIEIQDSCRQFLSHFGYRTISTNVENSLNTDTTFEAVYSNNLIEHLVAPHLFLARIYSLLKDGGLIALGHPITPIYPFDRIWAALGYKGMFAVEHINFFSTLGIEYWLKRSGFEILKQYSKPFDRIGVDRLGFLNKAIGAFSLHALTVAKKIDGYKYPSKRHRMFDPSWGSDLDVFRMEG